MIDHVAIFVPKGQLGTIADWYNKALRPLHYREIMRRPGAVGLGHEGIELWITECEDTSAPKAHIALRAPGTSNELRQSVRISSLMLSDHGQIMLPSMNSITPRSRPTGCAMELLGSAPRITRATTQHLF